MKFNTDLIYFNCITKNNILFLKNSYDWNIIIQKSQNGLYGEFGKSDDLDIDLSNDVDIYLSNVSHIITNIKVNKYGITGDIEILQTDKGKQLQLLIDNGVKMVFRPRSVGDVDINRYVTIKHLITFDSIQISEDHFYPIDILRTIKLNKIICIIKEKQKLNYG